MDLESIERSLTEWSCAPQATMGHAIKAGKLLLQAKAQLPHGQFLPWLESNCWGSARQAQRYMRAAKSKQ